jgi:hypothetical protein
VDLFIYVVLTFAAVIGPGCGLALLGRGPHEPGTWVAFAASSALLALISVRELRRDPDRLATFTTLLGLVWACLYGTAAGVVEVRPAAYAVVAALCGLLTVVSLIRVVRTALWKDELPSLRGLGWHPRALCELRDVQFALVSSPRQVRIDLQNCSQAEREVEFAFTPRDHDRAGAALRGRATLGPLHVGSLIIGLPHGFPGGRFRVTPKVSGPAGVRGRRWRARTYQPPISTGFQLVMLLAGHLMWGGGLEIELGASVDEGAGLLPPETAWKRIWPAA